jgi:hypothetical protein
MVVAGNDFPQQWQGTHALGSASAVCVMGIALRAAGLGDGLGWQVRFELCNGRLVL